MNASPEIRLLMPIMVVTIAAFGCSCKSKRSTPASNQTVFVASDAQQETAGTQGGEAGAAEASPPAPENPQLKARLDEAMKKTGFAPFGPSAAVHLKSAFAVAATRFLQGPGTCYAVLAACSVDAGSVAMRVTDESQSAITLMPYGEGTLDPGEVAAGLVCPSVEGLYSIQVKSTAGSGQCSVGVLGN